MVDEMNSITVVGEGKVDVKPDTASLAVGVQAMAATASEALRQANTSASALIAALHAAAIDNDDIATSGLSISARYNSDGTSIVGYQALNNLTVTVRDIERTGALIDAAAAAAGDSITVGGVSFYVDDTSALIGTARAAAIADARLRADQYAAAAGATVGEVLQIREGSIDIPIPRPLGGAMFAQKAFAATPIQSGMQEQTVTVTVVYQLQPSK